MDAALFELCSLEYFMHSFKKVKKGIRDEN